MSEILTNLTASSMILYYENDFVVSMIIEQCFQ